MATSMGFKSFPLTSPRRFPPWLLASRNGNGPLFLSVRLLNSRWKHSAPLWRGTALKNGYVPICHTLSLSNHRHLPDHLRRWGDEPGAHAGGFISTHQNSRGGRGHVFFRNAPGAN